MAIKTINRIIRVKNYFDNPSFTYDKSYLIEDYAFRSNSLLDYVSIHARLTLWI